MKIAIHDLIRSISANFSDKGKAIGILKNFLKRRLRNLKEASLDSEKIDTVKFLKQMFDIGKDKNVVALMLIDYDKRNAKTELPEFYQGMMKDVYAETIRQMYEYFKSPEFNPEDQVEWTTVYDNILTDVIDNKSVDYLTDAAEKTLSDVPKEEFWSQVLDEIEGMVQS